MVTITKRLLFHKYSRHRDLKADYGTEPKAIFGDTKEKQRDLLSVPVNYSFCTVSTPWPGYFRGIASIFRIIFLAFHRVEVARMRSRYCTSNFDPPLQMTRTRLLFGDYTVACSPVRVYGTSWGCSDTLLERDKTRLSNPSSSCDQDGQKSSFEARILDRVH